VAKRILGIDYGDTRTGLALSDELLFLASGIGTVKAYNDTVLISKIKEVVDKYGIEKAVLGNPVNMNGTIGERSLKAQAFAEKMRTELGIDVVMLDERCTTMAAHRILNETDTCGKKRKAAIDTLSAEIILQNYLDMIRK